MRNGNLGKLTTITVSRFLTSLTKRWYTFLYINFMLVSMNNMANIEARTFPQIINYFINTLLASSVIG